MNRFRPYNSDLFPFNIIMSKDDFAVPYPLFRSERGEIPIYCVSPNHGRSFVVAKCDERYIISKGNGLSYTSSSHINTAEMGDDTWGLLLKSDAIRDFTLGTEIASLGIKTNQMEYVIELDSPVRLSEEKYLNPVLLQYSVECPYRICDAVFMNKDIIEHETEKWEFLCNAKHNQRHLMAAEILMRNLAILHENGILYNAFHTQNYTWALELVDFELACSPKHPYSDEDSIRHVKDLFSREIIQTYEIVNYIAWCLNEVTDYCKIEDIMNNYNVELQVGNHFKQ